MIIRLIMYFPPLVWDKIRDYMGIWKFPYNKVLTNLPQTPHNSDYEHAMSIKYSYPRPGKTIVIRRKTNILTVPTIRFKVIKWPECRARILVRVLDIPTTYKIHSYWIDEQAMTADITCSFPAGC